MSHVREWLSDAEILLKDAGIKYESIDNKLVIVESCPDIEKIYVGCPYIEIDIFDNDIYMFDNDMDTYSYIRMRIHKTKLQQKYENYGYHVRWYETETKIIKMWTEINHQNIINELDNLLYGHGINIKKCR